LEKNLLIKGEGPEIYLRNNNIIRHVTNPNTFYSLGLQYLEINKINNNELNNFQKGGYISNYKDLNPELKDKIAYILKSNKLSVDIIIVNYNTQKYLKNCLNSIYQNTEYPFNIIIVDNNSTDGSRQYLKNLKNIKTIINTKNIGCAAGWNMGIKEGNNKYIVLLNPDTIVTPGWLYPLVKTAVSDPKISIIGTKHVNANEIVIHAGVIKENNKLINRSGVRDNPGIFSNSIDIEAVFGACFMIKRDLIPVLGLFDERYFLYAEESDYCINARKKGYRIVYCPSKIYHFERGAPMNPENRHFYHKKSIELLNKKWGEELYS
jgi:GT2 family glycosyltransferase